MNYKFTAVQFEGQVMGVSELLSHLFYDPSEEADREMDNKTMQVHVSPGAMGPGRMQHTVVGDVAFPEAFFPRMDAIFSSKLSRANNAAEGSVWRSSCQTPGQSNET